MFFLKTDRVYLYEDREDVYLDLYVVNDTRYVKADGILVIPGGGYGYVCMDREGEKTALAYAARGVNAFVLNYRAAEEDVYPMHLECAALAMAWIKNHAEEYATNPDRIFATGYSAGGHLCATLATKYRLMEEKFGFSKDFIRPLGVVLSYPVTTAYGPTHQGSFVNLLNKPFDSLTDEEKDFHSVELNVTENTPPAFMWHTAEDGAVPVQGTLKLAIAYANAKVPFALHVYPYGPHGLALATDFAHLCPQPLAEAWLDDSIKWMKTIK